MGYQQMTIKDLIDSLKKDALVLPALQREYVWDEEKITLLFDSLMKNYPIGPFMFWKVEEQDLKSYSFHKFVPNIDLLDKDYKEVDYIPSGDSVVAVLDGQQRINSLAIGLFGSYKSRVKASRKENGEHPKRYLALNLLHNVINMKEDQYEFKFLSDSELKVKDNDHYWYRLSDILDPSIKESDIWEYVSALNIHSESGKLIAGIKLVQKLYSIVFTDSIISYYTAVRKDLAEAVNIFTRINNTGKALTGTDLMLSMASAGSRENMHKRIADAIKQVTNATDDEIGFAPDKDFILTAMLMATGAAKISTTNSDNYLPSAIKKINDNWEDVVDAITSASVYIEQLGFNGKKIAKSFIHPIAYYFYKRGNVDPKKHYQSTDHKAQEDRISITQWLLRAQVKNIFAYGTPATLQDIRKIMDDAMVGLNKDKFPFDALLAHSQKSLKITSSEIDDICNWKYGDTKIVPLFTVLFNETIGSFDVDHMWPQTKMSTESKIKKAAKEAGDVVLQDSQIEFYKNHYNLLSNLQLLRKSPNVEKSASYYSDWLKNAFHDDYQRRTYMANSCVPVGISYNYDNFEEFYKNRKALLTQRMKDYFGVVEE